jgi:hypothetical protein
MLSAVMMPLNIGITTIRNQNGVSTSANPTDWVVVNPNILSSAAASRTTEHAVRIQTMANSSQHRPEDESPVAHEWRTTSIEMAGWISVIPAAGGRRAASCVL